MAKKTDNIRKTRKSGNSIVINLTDYAVENQYYKVEKIDRKITLTEIVMTEA
ncbi:MAG TPA: hypothetical protein VN368_01635 [Candidatus Methylomirabilis sp.]|nr:hypothetical protein [Candidatus Methylomirabilis sp.]